MLRFKLTLGVLVALIVGATTMQYTRSAWDPQPKPLALVDSAYHPINKTPHISYAGSGRRPDVMRAIMGMGGISLQGPGASSSSPTFYNDMYLNHTGATGVTCHWDANVDNNWLYLDCGLRLTSNMFMDTGTIGAAGAMTLNPATTFAVHGSNFDVTTAGVVTATGAITNNSGANDITAGHSFITASTTGGVAVTGVGGVYQMTNKMFQNVVPTISSGFGASPSVVTSNGTASFTINVGTGGAATSGVIALNSTAVNGWVCNCQDITTTPGTFRTVMTATSTTTCTVSNYNTTTAALAAWTASDILHCTAMGR